MEFHEADRGPVPPFLRNLRSIHPLRSPSPSSFKIFLTRYTSFHAKFEQEFFSIRTCITMADVISNVCTSSRVINGLHMEHQQSDAFSLENIGKILLTANGIFGNFN